MRSKTSYFNETVFWKNITHFWPVWLIYTILLLCMLPLRLLVNSGISYEGYSAQEIKEIFIYELGGADYAVKDILL